jgi:hypothetical protein
MRRRPDLIIPIRDRRQRRRILTLKNFRWVLLAFIFFFLGVTIQSDLRHSETNGDYGRIFGKQVSSQVVITPKNPDVVTETTIQDQTGADPLLLSAAARGQYLGVNVDPALSRIAPAGEPAPHSENVVSGPNGVTIVRGQTEHQQTLSGGIFRQ